MDIDEIFEKKLLFLIPFYIFSYEKEFDKIESDKKRLKELKSTYHNIIGRLETLCLNKEVSEYEKQTIIDMSKKVLEGIAAKYSNVREGVGYIMGGHVIDFPAKRVMDAGRAEGYEIGKAEALEQLKRINQLNIELIKLGRVEDVAHAAEDAEYQSKLLEEFKL